MCYFKYIYILYIVIYSYAYDALPGRSVIPKHPTTPTVPPINTTIL